MFIIKPELTKCNNCRWSKCSATGITWSLPNLRDCRRLFEKTGLTASWDLGEVGRTCLLKPASSSMAVRRSTSPAWAPCSIWTSETCATLTLKSCFLGHLPLQRVKVPVEEENSIHPWAMRQSINTRFTHSPPTSGPTFTKEPSHRRLWKFSKICFCPLDNLSFGTLRPCYFSLPISKTK